MKTVVIFIVTVILSISQVHTTNALITGVGFLCLDGESLKWPTANSSGQLGCNDPLRKINSRSEIKLSSKYACMISQKLSDGTTFSVVLDRENALVPEAERCNIYESGYDTAERVLIQGTPPSQGLNDPNSGGTQTPGFPTTNTTNSNSSNNNNPPKGNNNNPGPSNNTTGGVQGSCPENFVEKGPLCVPANPFANSSGIAGNGTVGGLATTIINILLGISGIIAVIMIIIGGFQWMTARGNEAQVTNGRKTVINALIGLVIVILSYAVVQAVSNFITKGTT